MLHILHGADVISSRRELNTLQKRFGDREIIVLDGKKLTLTQLKQALESKTLFGNERVVIVERLFRQFSRGKTKQLDQFLTPLISSSHEVIIWEEKEISKTFLKKFPQGCDIALFKPSQLLFRFLQNLTPGKSAQAVEQFTKLVQKEPVELVLYLLVRQIRLLLMISSEAKLQLAPWQEQRLCDQAKRFSSAQLRRMYAQLFIIDTHIKRGLSPFDLTNALKLFLIDL